MRLFLDHHIPAAVANQLLRYGHDVVTARDLRAEEFDDEALWRLGISERRVVVTYDIADFQEVLTAFVNVGQSHHGLVLVSNSTIQQGDVGALVAALDQFIRTHENVEDGVYFLRRAARDR